MSSATLYREERYGEPAQFSPATRRAGRTNTAAPKLSRKDQAFLDRIAARQRTTEDDIYEDESRPARRSSNRQRNTTDNLRYADDYRQPRKGAHPLFTMGIGMLLFILLWSACLFIFSQWTLRISDPASHPNGIYFLSDVFGHNDSPQNPTEIEALNFRGQAEIIELPGGDPTRAKVYPGPDIKSIIGFEGNPLTAVIYVQAIDINQGGKKDLIVDICGDIFAWNFQRGCIPYYLINTGSGFKAA